jgi:hypothetical protein
MTERDDLDAPAGLGTPRRPFNSGWRESGVMVETPILIGFFHTMIQPPVTWDDVGLDDPLFTEVDQAGRLLMLDESLQ